MRQPGAGTTITLPDEAGQSRPSQCPQEAQQSSKTSEEASLSSHIIVERETMFQSAERGSGQSTLVTGESQRKPWDVESCDVFLSNAEF